MNLTLTAPSEDDRVAICVSAAHKYARSYRGFLAILDNWLATYLKDKPQAPKLGL
jgi:hypothetical protein